MVSIDNPTGLQAARRKRHPPCLQAGLLPPPNPAPRRIPRRSCVAAALRPPWARSLRRRPEPSALSRICAPKCRRAPKSTRTFRYDGLLTRYCLPYRCVDPGCCYRMPNSSPLVAVVVRGVITFYLYGRISLLFFLFTLSRYGMRGTPGRNHA